MTDLTVINRPNSIAVQWYAAEQARAGKFVLLKFTALEFVDFSSFETERERNAAAIAWGNSAPEHRVSFINPPKDSK